MSRAPVSLSILLVVALTACPLIRPKDGGGPPDDGAGTPPEGGNDEAEAGDETSGAPEGETPKGETGSSEPKV